MDSRLSRRAVLGWFGMAQSTAAQSATASGDASDDAFLENLSRRAFRFFEEHSDRATGLVLDRARNDGALEPRAANMATIAATGFGLTALAIAAERRWMPRGEAAERVRTTLRAFDSRIENHHGWYFHFLDGATGARYRDTELSSIDTALLLAGVLSARAYFSGDREIVELATEIYRRVDFQWMLNGHPHLLSHGWKPESGFLPYRWDQIDEGMLLYALAIASPTHAIPPESWYAWKRTPMTYAGIQLVSNSPLFTHQYPLTWLDLRGICDAAPSSLNYYSNAIRATEVNRAFCANLGREFPRSYSTERWGLSASDGEKGYFAWGNPPHRDDVDGTLVPCAPGGSLMLAPEICLRDLRQMRQDFGDRIWGRYGFADAFNPTTGWTDRDVLGIDLGITLLSAENLRSGFVWKQFAKNAEFGRFLSLARFKKCGA